MPIVRSATAACRAPWVRSAPSVVGHWPACVAVLFLLAPCASAQSLKEAALNDCRLTLKARQALLQDESLAPLNLGVSVRNHVATLWGPVSSAALAQRAVERLWQVPGVARVINQLVVETPGDPLLDFLKTPRLPPARPPDKKPRLDRIAAPGTPPKPAHSLTGQERSPPQDATIAVLAPIALPVRSAVPPAVLLRPVVDPSGAGVTRDDRHPDPLVEAIERLLQGNERLRRIRPEVNGRTVHLRGTAQSREDLMTLARAIARLPGVERVVLEDVRTERR